MPCLPCTPLQPEVKLLEACYPPPKQILGAGPDFNALSQDLSKLTYYAINKPSKLKGIGEELEKRASKEAQRSSSGYPRYRASLLISLDILRKLISECKRDLALFARSALHIISLSLDVRGAARAELDTEVVARASQCFIAFTTYTDGSGLGVDDALTGSYAGLLRQFARLAVYAPPSEKPDAEQQARVRVIGLAGLTGAATSDALFTSTTAEFPRQVGIIVPALVANLAEPPLAQLERESAKAADSAPSPFFSELSARRPVNDRRAPSMIHGHQPGEKGPGPDDVLSAALRALNALVGQCQLGQTSHLLEAVLAAVGRAGLWADVDRCAWLATRLVALMQLQYRFVVPTHLAELVVDLDDASPATPMHVALVAMVTAVLNSPTSLVGLAVTDILANLVTVLVRRVRVDQRDALLPALVSSVASLATHIYYADQINDIVEEISFRIAEVPAADSARQEILRVLVTCIAAVMTTTDAGDDAEARLQSPALPEAANGGGSVDKGKAPQVGTPMVEAPPRRAPGRRNPIAPEVWQETLPLLCEASYPVRATYARALILFLEREMPRAGSKPQPPEPSVLRFCSALHAALYTLAMSSALGSEPADPDASAGSASASPAMSRQPSESALSMRRRTASTPTPAVVDAAGKTADKPEKGVTFNVVAPTPGETPSATPPRKPSRTSRRVSLPLNRLNSSLPLVSFDNVATPFDYAALLRVLDELHAACPVAALLTGAPMLLALDRDAGLELVRRSGDGRAGAWVLERKRAAREVVALAWRRIAARWHVAAAVELADKALNVLPEPFVVPDMRDPPPADAALPAPDQAFSFERHELEGEPSAASRPLLDPEVLTSSFASSPAVQAAAKLDAAALMQRLGAPWTVETAIKESVERYSAATPKAPGDAHFGVAGALMQGSNASYQSFGRPPSRAVDVDDLREALGTGRPETPSAAPSIVSNGRATLAGDDARRRPQADVKEVLKDIFKDKKQRAGGKAGAADAPAPTMAKTNGASPHTAAPDATANGSGTVNGSGANGIELGRIA